MTYMEGVQVDFQKLVTDWAILETVEDFENLIARYLRTTGTLNCLFYNWYILLEHRICSLKLNYLPNMVGNA